MRKLTTTLLLGLSLVLLPAPSEAQRGGRPGGSPTPTRPQTSRPQVSRPQASRPQVSRPSPSIPQASRPTPSVTPRPSVSRPSVAPTRPSLPQSTAPRPAMPSVRGSSQLDRGTTSVSPTRPSVTPLPTPGSRGSSAYTGRVVPRSVESVTGVPVQRPESPDAGRPSIGTRYDAMPERSAVGGVGDPDRAGADSLGGSAGLDPGLGQDGGVGAGRPRGRVQFPAPYRPAGTPSRGLTSGSRPTTVRGTTPGEEPGRGLLGGSQGSVGRPAGTPSRGIDRYRGAPVREESGRTLLQGGTIEGRTVQGGRDATRGDAPLVGVGTGSPDRGVGGRPRASDGAAGIDRGALGGERGDGGPRGKAVALDGRGDPTPTRYASGPVTRLDTPRPIRPSGPTSGPDTVLPGRPSRGGVSGASALERPGRAGGTRDATRLRTEDAVRALKRRDPRAGATVQAGGAAVGYAGGAVVGASIAAVSGVYATPYLGNRGFWAGGYYAYPPSYYRPWGWCSFGSSWSFALTFNLGWYCSSWFWPSYVSCWYPIWYTHYRPWAPVYYAYAPAVYETVVYRTVYEDQYVGAPVETAETVEPETQAAAPAAPSSVEIAAERYLTLGDRAFREGRYTDAVQLYAKAAELTPHEASLYLVLADALFAAGDYHYGAYAIRRGLELDPGLADVVVDKHDFYEDPRDFERQLAVLEQYVIDHRSDRDARLVLALNYLFGGRPAAAVDLLESPASAALAGDPAAERILDSARRVQYGPPAPAGGAEEDEG